MFYFNLFLHLFVQIYWVAKHKSLWERFLVDLKDTWEGAE